MAALLYCLIDITSKKEEGLDSSTSQLCKWNQARKRRLSPKKASSLAKRHCVENFPPSTVDFDSFSEKLKSCLPNAGYLKSNSNAPSDSEDPKSQSKIDFLYHDNTRL